MLLRRSLPSLLVLVGPGFLAVESHAACTADRWEQDDACIPSRGFVLGGQPQSNNFCDDAVDWVTLHACPGRVYTIETANLGTLTDTVLELYDRDCATLLTSDDDGAGGKASRIANWTAPAQGSYHLRVRQKDASLGDNRGYDLLVTGDTTPCDTWSRDFTPVSSGSARELGGLTLTADGGIVAAGEHLDGGGASWVVRLDAAGHVSWQKAYDAATTDHAYAVAVASDGGILVVAQVSDTGTGATWGAAMKLDASGNVAWQTRVGSGDDYLAGIAPTSDGGAVAAGQYATGNDYDGWIVRLSSAGAVLWSKTYGGSQSDAFHAIAASPDGSFVAVGVTASSGAGADDAYAVKVDANGTLVWQRTYGGAGYDTWNAVAVAQDGGMALGGSLDASPDAIAWIVKADASGAITWQRSARAGDRNSSANGLAFLADGSVVVASPLERAAGTSNEIWISRFDTSGGVLWQRYYDGVGEPGAVVPTSDGGMALAATAEGHQSARVLYLDAAGSISTCNALTPASAVVAPSSASTATFSTGPKNVGASAASPGLVAGARSGPEGDYCPCATPSYSGVLFVDKILGSSRIQWTSGGAALFDVVRGDLPTLRSTGGDFTGALNQVVNASFYDCVANDSSGTGVDDPLCCPDLGSGWFFLMRPAADFCPGTYDDGTASQVGARDREVNDAGYACP
jgi:hypothetical protein